MEKLDNKATHSITTSTTHQTTTQVSPDPIFQMVTGYWVSKTLMTAVELDVFTKLSGNKTVTFEQLQNDILDMDKRPAEVFATALVSLGLITVNSGGEAKKKGEEEKKKVYSNSRISEVFLDKNKSSYIGDFIIMMDKRLYSRWAKLPVSLKTNRPVESAEEGDISARTMFDNAKTNQVIEQMQMFTRAMYGVSVGPAMALAKVF